ncbi:hypothetical protein FB451DRAFT_1367684 [Mycena latifolia]|nr:hypothetical protein FB451DRAFT_1367684 [Mycena latifolia]
MSSAAAELKAQGNALFSDKDFAEADEKYTEAIQASDEAIDPKGLAVLYANRAACRLSLKRYLDADEDARKATQLDPTYAKAFARLATAQDALGNYSDSKEIGSAHSTRFLRPSLRRRSSSSGSSTRRGCTPQLPGCSSCRARQPTITSWPPGRMPWDLAAVMIPRLRVARPVNADHIYSSAWVIHGAYEEFTNGVNKMKQLQNDPVTGHIRGIPFLAAQAIVDLANGILRDARVVHCTGDAFIARYNKQRPFSFVLSQVVYEVKLCRAWTDTLPEVVVREAFARQRAEGWEAARWGVSLTIRPWLMRAIMDAGLLQRHETAAELLKRTLDVLRTLQENWVQVPKAERGVVFEPSFLFGIQRLYIDSLMQSYALNPAPELLEELDKESDLLIREVDETLRQPRSQNWTDPGFFGSFYLYPRGLAYAMKAFTYTKKAALSPNDARDLHRQAALAYITAADAFPQDDEQHPLFLKNALENMFQAHSFSLRETLGIMERIRLSAPQARAIWENSALGVQGLWGVLEGVGRREEELRGMLARGEVAIEECVGAAA